MRILGLGAAQFNSRDGIIVEGCKSILNINHFDRYIMIKDHESQSYTDFYPEEEFDLIVYCGTPWLWDQMQHTPKYANTLAVRSVHPEAKMIWLGLGSSLYLSDENSHILRNPVDQQMLRDTFKEDLVFTRGSLAHDILNLAGVKNHFLPCPSYFFKPVCQTSKESDVMFYHAPQTGIAAGYFDKQRLNEYIEIFRSFYLSTPSSVIVAVCEPEEIEMVKSLGFMTPILLKDPIDTFNLCKKARRVLSGRIHNAVPALVYGAEVGIVPVDSRHRVLTDHFDIGVNNASELGKIKSCDIVSLVDGNIGTYRKIIKDYLK